MMWGGWTSVGSNKQQSTAAFALHKNKHTNDDDNNNNNNNNNKNKNKNKRVAIGVSRPWLTVGWGGYGLNNDMTTCTYRRSSGLEQSQTCHRKLSITR